MHTSNVAPPQTSRLWKLTWSIFWAMGSIDSVRMRVAMSDWWASRKVVSVILIGFMRVLSRFIVRDNIKSEADILSYL